MKGKIILFRGLPGAGKTFLSSKIAAKTNMAIIRKDDIYDPVSNYIESHMERNEICYQVIYNVIETVLHAKANLIIDCSFRDHKDLNTLSNFIEGRNGKLKSVLCTCTDENLWRTRFNKRKINSKPNNIITDFEDMKRHYANLQLEKYKDELVMDTKEKSSLLIEEITKYI
ncbi:MAG TPA: AAA family ATPase, partial [Ginsengibacter sp.]|nr:AAA family ATPase [Ginsengibacter sp.]